MSRKVAKRYAKALFLLSDENPEAARQHLASLDVLAALFTTEAGKVLASPVWPTVVKKDLLDYGLEQGHATSQVRELVQTLLASGRVDELPDLVLVYKELIDQAEGIVHAEITSAVELSSADLDAIKSEVGKLLDKKIMVTPKVDQSLLGGFVVRAGYNVIDLSLKTKLDALTQSVAQV